MMIERIGRLIVHETSSLLAHPSYQELAKREHLARAEAAGRYWIARSREIGLNAIPSEADIQEFTRWLNELAGNDPSEVANTEPNSFSPLRYSLRDIFSKAILNTILHAACSPSLAALIPPHFYDVLENYYLPFHQRKTGIDAKCHPGHLRAEFHQMLGHCRSCQEAMSVDSDAVLLLQLYSDRVLNMGFGDLGSVSFWNKPGDLSSRRFENAWGEIVGH
jgi:uncharacterized protein YwqG